MSDTKKKILIVATSLGHGGAERASAAQSFIYTNLGYDVYIVTILSSIVYKYSGTLINLGTSKDKDNSTLGRVRRLLVFRKLLKQHAFSFIVDNRARNQWYRELIISKLIYNCPVIYMVHSYDEAIAFTPYKWLNKYLYKNARMVAVSNKVANKFKSKYRLKRIITIHNCLDFDTIAKQSREPLIDAYNYKYILYYGRLHDYSKNLKLLLEAYATSDLKNKNIKLVILGDGPDEAMIKAFSSALKLNRDVVFKGFANNPFPLVKQAYFTILASRSEGFALTLVESLSLETPVISVDCEAGPKEIIQHEVNGLLAENHNVVALSHEMNRLVNDSELYERCKRNSKASVEKFELKNTIHLWKKLFK